MKSEHITFSDIIIISWLPFITFQVLTTQTYHFSYHFSYHCDTIFCDTLRGLLTNQQMPSSPYKSSITATFQPLLLVNDLKNEKLQIITLIRRPQNRVIRCLRAELDLAQPLVRRACRLADRLGKQFLCHKV